MTPRRFEQGRPRSRPIPTPPGCDPTRGQGRIATRTPGAPRPHQQPHLRAHPRWPWIRGRAGCQEVAPTAPAPALALDTWAAGARGWHSRAHPGGRRAEATRGRRPGLGAAPGGARTLLCVSGLLAPISAAARGHGVGTDLGGGRGQVPATCSVNQSTRRPAFRRLSITFARVAAISRSGVVPTPASSVAAFGTSAPRSSRWPRGGTACTRAPHPPRLGSHRVARQLGGHPPAGDDVGVPLQPRPRRDRRDVAVDLVPADLGRAARAAVPPERGTRPPGCRSRSRTQEHPARRAAGSARSLPTPIATRGQYTLRSPPSVTTRSWPASCGHSPGRSRGTRRTHTRGGASAGRRTRDRRRSRWRPAARARHYRTFPHVRAADLAVGHRRCRPGRPRRQAHPVTSSAAISDRVGGRVVLKAENLQRTGSFKVRGDEQAGHARRARRPRRHGWQCRQPRPGDRLRGTPRGVAARSSCRPAHRSRRWRRARPTAPWWSRAVSRSTRRSRPLASRAEDGACSSATRSTTLRSLRDRRRSVGSCSWTSPSCAA